MATKEQVIADRTFATERYILSTMPVLYLPLYRLDSGESGDSFISSDGHGYECTVTDSLWRFDGRYFDGTNDYISIPDHASLDITDAVTVEAWVNPSDMGSGSPLIHSVVSKGVYTSSYLLAWEAGEIWTGRINNETAGSIAITGFGSFDHIVIRYDKDGGAGAQLVMILNGVVGTYHADYSTAIGTNNDPLYIAEERIPTQDRTLIGCVGEIRIYNRGLTLLEVQRNYLATKWRYQ